jgi:hypothetical protein
MCFESMANRLPSLTFISSCEERTFTMANSAATKKPLNETRRKVIKISRAIITELKMFGANLLKTLVIEIKEITLVIYHYLKMEFV